MPPNSTLVAPVSPVPVTTTFVPTAPVTGANAVTFGPATVAADASETPNTLDTRTATPAVAMIRILIDNLLTPRMFYGRTRRSVGV